MVEIDTDDATDDVAKGMALAFGLEAGLVPLEGKVISKQYPGDSKAEALGRAYHYRDKIRENGGECDVRYIEEAGTFDGDTYHTIEIEVTEGA